MQQTRVLATHFANFDALLSKIQFVFSLSVSITAKFLTSVSAHFKNKADSCPRRHKSVEKNQAAPDLL